MAKGFLSQNRIPHTVRILDEPESIADCKRRLGFLMAPAIVVGERAVLGFNRAELVAALKQAGLYPGAEAASSQVAQPASRRLDRSVAGAVAVANFYGDSLT